MTHKLLLLSVALLTLWLPVQAEAAAWVVQHLESMEYPLLGVQSREQATIRVQCQVATDGTVVDARVIERSGAPRPGSVLEKGAIENARKWTFRYSPGGVPEQPGTATLVYVFRLEGSCDYQRCPSRFAFDMPDRVTVTAQFRPLHIQQEP
jgi:TonB family protein